MNNKFVLLILIIFIPHNMSRPADQFISTGTETLALYNNSTQVKDKIHEFVDTVPKTLKTFALKVKALAGFQNTAASEPIVESTAANSQSKHSSEDLLFNSTDKWQNITDDTLRQLINQFQANYDKIEQLFKILNISSDERQRTHEILNNESKYIYSRIQKRASDSNDTRIKSQPDVDYLLPNATNAGNGSLEFQNETELSTIFSITEVSTQPVANETDVEFVKYGGYISTKTYHPLCQDECVTQSTNESVHDVVTNGKPDLHEPVSNADVNFVPTTAFTLNMPTSERTTSIPKTSKIAEQDLEAFINALDEHISTIGRTTKKTPQSSTEETQENTPTPQTWTNDNKSLSVNASNLHVMNTEPKVSVTEQNQSEHFSDQNQYEQKTSFISIHQEIPDFDGKILKEGSPTSETDQAYSSSEPALTHSNGEIIANLDYKYKTAENRVLELAKKLTMDGTNETYIAESQN